MFKPKNYLFLSFYLKANQATVTPPLSTVLGNEGVKTLNFCEDFNKVTEQLPEYFELKVFVKINKSFRTWELKLGYIIMSKLLQYISKEGEYKVKVSGGFSNLKYFFIDIKDLYLLSFLKYNSIKKSFILNILSVLKSTGIKVIIN